jgi:hypothetical protein
MEQPRPRASGTALQLRRKDGLDPVPMGLPPDFDRFRQRRMAQLLGEIADHLIANLLVIVVKDAHRCGDVARR